MDNTAENKISLRKKFNEKVYNLGSLKISLVHLLLLIIINVSLACIIVNLFVKGTGLFTWWSVLLTALLIFAYLVLRIFTSSGIMLGRQVTFLITLFNLFFNLMKTFGMVKSQQHWELTFLIPLVNLLCMLFLVFVFVVRKKKFKALIIPSLKISLVSAIPIIRLYFLMEGNHSLPIFNYVVMILAFALFANALFLNWLTLMKIAETNLEMIKKGASAFKKTIENVETVNKKIDSFNKGIGKVKSFWKVSGDAFKEFFTIKKKKELPEQQVEYIEQDNKNIVDDTSPKEKVITIKEKKHSSFNKLYGKAKTIFKRKEENIENSYENQQLVLCDKSEDDNNKKDKKINKLVHKFKKH